MSDSGFESDQNRVAVGDMSPASTGACEAASEAPRASSYIRTIRRLILLCILVAVICSLTYDRLVARPGVEEAYNKVGRLHEKHSASSRRPITNKEIQELLKRQPSRVYSEGPYEVEVYGWSAGLPYRNREYFVIYTGKDYLAGPVGWEWSGKLTFLTHYKYAIAEEDFNRPDPTPFVRTDSAGQAKTRPPRSRPRRPAADTQNSSGQSTDAVAEE